MGTAISADFGSLLKDWRNHRRVSQLRLSTESGISQRHISFLETGRSNPSRAMILALADSLDIPLRERNTLLQTAGYSAIYSEESLTDASNRVFREALQATLDHQEPFPAMVLDGRWNLVMANQGAMRFFGLFIDVADALGRLGADDFQMIRLCLADHALRPYIRNWQELVYAFLQRTRRALLVNPRDTRLPLLIEEIVKIYPEPNLKDLLVGKDSVLSKKILNVAGVPLSLDDIQFTILKQNYDNDPLVIYGLYQGIIGGPNIRKSAYTGKYVYADLIDNTMEFINSNRGTYSKNSRTFRVSSLYERNAAFFPDFDTDLTGHLLTYLEGDEHAELQAATKIKTDINDWTVTDLYGSSRDPGASLANNGAALDGAVSGSNSSRLTTKSVVATRYNPAVLQHLNELKAKKEAERTGTVTIEEMGEATAESSATDQNDQEGD